MIVEPYDNPLRFIMKSETQADVSHLVDLGENSGFGKCSCQQFEFRIGPALAEGHRPPRCKHLVAARDHLADEVIKKLMEA